MSEKTKKRINWLLIQAAVLLYGALGECLKEATADEITECLKEAYKLYEV